MSASVGLIPAEQMMTVASLALLMYEYLLTLGPEIERFWKGRLWNGLSWGSFLFFANRYFTLLGYIPITLELLNNPDMDLKVYPPSHFVSELSLMHDGMMMLRICALYQRRVRILAVPLIFVICAVTIGMVGMVKSPPQETPIPFRCDSGWTANQAYYFAGAYGGEFMFDVTIFAMTFYKTLRSVKGSGFKLLTMIMRDGTMYFGITATFNLANILVLIFANPVNRGAMNNPLNIVSSIMMTRLMLNLRDPKLNGSTEESKLTPIRFNGLSSRETGESSIATLCDEENV